MEDETLAEMSISFVKPNSNNKLCEFDSGCFALKHANNDIGCISNTVSQLWKYFAEQHRVTTSQHFVKKLSCKYAKRNKPTAKIWSNRKTDLHK